MQGVKVIKKPKPKLSSIFTNNDGCTNTNCNCNGK